MEKTESVYKAYDLERGWNRPKSFRSWCEDNGRRYGHVPSFEEFETNAKAYEAYRELWFSEQADAHSTAYPARTPVAARRTRSTTVVGVGVAESCLLFQNITVLQKSRNWWLTGILYSVFWRWF